MPLMDFDDFSIIHGWELEHNPLSLENEFCWAPKDTSLLQCLGTPVLDQPSIEIPREASPLDQSLSEASALHSEPSEANAEQFMSSVLPNSKLENTPTPLKPPLNSFMVFANQHRPLLQNQVGCSNKDISIILGMMWRNMSDSEKKPYLEKAAQLKAEFQASLPDPSAGKIRRKRKPKTLKQTIQSSRVIRPIQSAPDFPVFPVYWISVAHAIPYNLSQFQHV